MLKNPIQEKSAYDRNQHVGVKTEKSKHQHDKVSFNSKLC